MGIPVRLSDELVALAKDAADRATRSLTSQVEHWALIGHAVETALDHADLTKLKTSGGKVGKAFPNAADRSAITQAILRVVREMDRDVLGARIYAGEGPLYGEDPSNPGVIVRYEKSALRAAAVARQKAAKYKKRG